MLMCKIVYLHPMCNRLTLGIFNVAPSIVVTVKKGSERKMLRVKGLITLKARDGNFKF